MCEGFEAAREIARGYAWACFIHAEGDFHAAVAAVGVDEDGDVGT